MVVFTHGESAFVYVSLKKSASEACVWRCERATFDLREEVATATFT